MNRGMTVLTTWRILLGDKQPTDEEHFSAIVLAWCVEFVRKLFILPLKLFCILGMGKKISVSKIISVIKCLSVNNNEVCLIFLASNFISCC